MSERALLDNNLSASHQDSVAGSTEVAAATVEPAVCEGDGVVVRVVLPHGHSGFCLRPETPF